MNRTTRLLSGIVAVGFLALPAIAKPNFTGSWKLVADKSDFGPMPIPEKYEQVVNHADPDVKVKVTQVSQQGEATGELNYNTEGKEIANQFRGAAMKSVAKWDGDAMLVDSKLDFQGNEVTLSDKWELSGDGKTLVINRKINSPQGELEMKLVLSKD